LADRIVARGQWGTVEWALDERGRMPASTSFAALNDIEKAKVLALFKRLADTGRISNTEKFKKIGKVRNQDLFEFKSFQERFIGGFRPGKKFIVALGLTKKKDKHNSADLEAAARILSEHDDWNLK
jgi:hypothetical protein